MIAAKKLTAAVAREYLREAEKRAPKLWIRHSYYVGLAAGKIAARVPGMDADLATAYGFLHDIGRRFGEMKINHIFCGWRYLRAEGYEEAARICLTHSFPVQDARSVTGVWDSTEEDIAFLQEYLPSITYTDYDRLIQLADVLGDASGIVVLEKRLVDIIRRYGLDAANVPSRWAALFAIKEDFERRMGVTIEEALELRPCSFEQAFSEEDWT